MTTDSSWTPCSCESCFFKQKTAYDKRISDCSSDVCSSDLRAGEDAFDEPAEGSAGEQGVQQGAQRARAAHHGQREEATQQDAPAARQVQIGRASCRERVCQYE